MTDQVVTTDSWLAQSVGGSKEYGNGTNGLIHVGPVPAEVSGSPDLKSRGIYEVSLVTVFAGLTSINTGFFTAVVAPNTCMGSRGGNINILLEEVTTEFNNKSAAGDCKLSSGTGLGVWGISNSINIANRAFHTSGAHSTGDLLTWNITGLLQRKLAEGATVLRFRLIAALASGSGYDELTAGRRIALYSVRDATPANRPFISVNGSAGSVAKTASEVIALADSFVSKSILGSGTVTDTDSFFVTETSLVTEAPQWSTVLDSMGHGIGQIVIPEPADRALALLPGAVATDCQVQCQFKMDKIPAGDFITWRLVVRAINNNSLYELAIQVQPTTGMGLVLQKRVSGVVTVLNTFSDNDTFIAGDWYWVKLEAIGSAPTTLAAKLWRAASQEPGWGMFTLDSEASLQAPGSVGLGFQTMGGLTDLPYIINFDDFTGLSL